MHGDLNDIDQQWWSPEGARVPLGAPFRPGLDPLPEYPSGTLISGGSSAITRASRARQLYKRSWTSCGWASARDLKSAWPRKRARLATSWLRPTAARASIASWPVARFRYPSGADGGSITTPYHSRAFSTER